jgi:hypothetical protein
VTAQKRDGYALYVKANGRASGGAREGTITIGGWFQF